MTSSCSLIFKDFEECSPTGIHDGFRQVMIFQHVRDLKVFDHDTVIPFGIGLSNFEMVITPLTSDFQVRLGDVLSSLTLALTPLLTTRKRALFTSQGLLRSAIETGISNGVTLTISQEGLETYVNADIRMRARTRSMFCLGLSFTDNESVPMSICTHHQVSCFRGSLKRTMHLDLERFPKLSRHDQVFLILMHMAVFAILPELQRVPAVRCFETRKAHIRKVMLFGGKKAFEGLRDPISQHLDRCSWHMLALPFEGRLQVILAWERAMLCIVSLDGLKHAIIDLS